MLPEENTGGERNLETLLFKFRWQIAFLLVGIAFAGVGILLAKSQNVSSPKIEVLESKGEGQESISEIIVEVVGAVEKPGVYTLSKDTRVEDALIAAGGVSANADRPWMEKSLNRAAKLVDGQKIYIPKKGEDISEVATFSVTQTKLEGRGSGPINVNTASKNELESLWGIGPVTAQNIIEHRPYSSVEELLSKKILKSNVYESNKEKLTVY